MSLLDTESIPTPRPPLGWPTKVAYALGGVSQFLKIRLTTAFLLIYYNQVVGLDAAVVSALMMITVVVDAFVDPIIGQWSDRYRSRWGRRHPFMYASAVPAAVLFFMLWAPPVGWSDGAIAAYFFVVLIALRIVDTLFDLPSAALLPELVTDYDERAKLVALRQFFGHVTAMGVTVLAYNVFLKEGPDGSGGVLAADGYRNMALAGAVVMFVSTMIASIGTHRQIPWLRSSPARPLSFSATVAESLETLRTPSFLTCTVAGIGVAVAIGLKGTLEVYWNLYLFRLSQSDIALISAFGIAGTVLGAWLSPRLIERFDQKRAAIGSLWASIVLTTGPIVLWLMDLLPPEKSTGLVILLIGDQILNSAAWLVILVCLSAMMADVADDTAVRTGRRSEGLLFASQSFILKVVGGLGIFVSGLMLSLVDFPVGAERQSVPSEALTDLATAFVPVMVMLHLIAILVMRTFKLNRSTHAANLAALSLMGEIS